MRRVMLTALVMVLVVGAGAQPARAQGRPGDSTVVEKQLIIAPGANVRECFDATYMTTLTVIASSPEGRTGETAHLLFSEDRQTVSPLVYLATNLTPDETISSHLAGAGTYCYDIAVTHNLVSPLPPDALEKPYKRVWLKIISTPLP